MDTGHLLVAEIAKTQLAASQVAAFDGLLEKWAQDFPGMSDFVSSSVWPDHIKCTRAGRPMCDGLPPAGLNEFDTWHYVDLDFNPDHVQVEQQNPYQNPSAVWALAQAMRTFQTSRSEWALNFMLRFVLHIVGDLHQPLHCAEGLFNDTKFGDVMGDRGGNLIRIRTQWRELTNLHLLWDAAGGLYMAEWPFSSEQQAQLRRNASQIMKRFPRSSLKELNAADMSCYPSSDCAAVFRGWVKDVHALAIQDAYRGVRAGAEPSAAYLARVREVSRRQLALAGYRLADLLAAVSPSLPTPAAEGNNTLGNTLNIQAICALQGLLLVIFGAMLFRQRLARQPAPSERGRSLLECGEV
ncbi:unnamed protein product [Effrenium voratum]|uniref:Uncharacterized protein n=1 Tax=Effrenium voratum TaxID=2562239 RepID=A0AA36IIE4_9DINO|nr:unnamed protein product [Effrenium voratum]